MKKYYLHNDSIQQGPFDIEELKTKNISKETPIWYDGLSEWMTVENIDELKILLVSVPPPLKAPPLIQKLEPNNQSEQKKNNLSLYALIIGVVLVLVLGLTYLLKSKSPENESHLSTTKNSSFNDNRQSQNPIIVQPKSAETVIKTNNENIVAEKLIGSHNFGVQFIWDGYGTATISKNDENFKIVGTQYSKDNNEYCKIDGDINVINDRTLKFTGSITIFTNECCGIISKNGNFTFIKTGNRKYWRLQERNELCNQYTCAYYLDIFE